MPHATANRIRPQGRKSDGHNGEVRKGCVTVKHTATDGKGSSSEYSSNNAVNLNVDATDTGDDYGFNWNNDNKDNSNDNNRVRPVLAFRWKCFLTRFFLNNMTEQEIIEEQLATGINYLMRVGQFYHAYDGAAFALARLTGYQVPRLHRYDLGSRMVDYGLNMAELIREANTTREKGPALERFLLCHGNLMMVLRACSDLRIIDSKKHAQLTLLLVRIGKQATAWKNRYSACGKTSTTAPIALGAPSPSS